MEIEILNQWTIHYKMRSSKTIFLFPTLPAKTNTKANTKSIFPQTTTTKLMMGGKRLIWISSTLFNLS